MALNINKIKELPERTENFNDLVLPKRHRVMVSSLVKMHSTGTKPVDGVDATMADDQEDTQEDLVRGKGKGLILLLHGKALVLSSMTCIDSSSKVCRASVRPAPRNWSLTPRRDHSML